jgi:hypothetical protein
MANSKRQSTLDALNKYSQRQLDEAKPREVKHHGKPENEVEKACMELMRSWGWSVQVIESKANWNGKAWVQQGAKQGTADCIGNTENGVSVAVEFKAPGRLSSFNTEKRYLQRKFIVDKINTNAFACVVDSAERLECIFMRWSALLCEDKNRARSYLLSMLPSVSDKKKLKDDKLFDDE